ncbi:MAG: Phosphoheptose isomerase [Calditrichaeota bacterium]|nr:Phosphoheptose isomerase [Calditrichota bacterium]
MPASCAVDRQGFDQMELSAQIRERLDAHIEVSRRMAEIGDDLAGAVELVTGTFRGGSRVLLAGNGGSAADAQHWAAEWVIRLSADLDRPAMPALALTTDTSALTAGANDLGYENVFARQIEAHGRDGDLLIAISTSGNSPNLLRAADVAHEMGMNVLGVLGRGGGRLRGSCDLAVVVPSGDTQRIQEMHALIGHILCELSERALVR